MADLVSFTDGLCFLSTAVKPAEIRSTHMDFLFDLNAKAVASLPHWWERIDENPKWQEYSFVALAIAYGLIALVAVVQLVRIQQRVPEYGWTTQKVFPSAECFCLHSQMRGICAAQQGRHIELLFRIPCNHICTHIISQRLLVTVSHDAVKN